MIIIACTGASITFQDTCCNNKETIFPPFRLYEFAEGATVFGADGKSFYIPDNTTYTINDTAYSYEETLEQLNLCFIAIGGLNEVQCYDDLASFPAVGEECSIYIDEDTNKIYRWDGSAYVELSESIELYDAIVADDGTGDYLLPSAALAAGETSIFVKDGTYVETASPTVINDGTRMQGESIENTKIILTAGASFTSALDAGYEIGTIAINTNTDAVTLTGGVFPLDIVDEYIRINKTFYKVLSRDSDTTLTIDRVYKGDSVSGKSYSVRKYITGTQLEGFTISGWNGVDFNTTNLLALNNILYGTLRNLFVQGTKEDCICLENVGHLATENVLGLDGGAGVGGSGNGTGYNIVWGVMVRTSICDFNNSHALGIAATGLALSFDTVHSSNNGSGLNMDGSTEGSYKYDNCAFSGNNAFGVRGEADAKNVVMSNTEIQNNGTIGCFIEGDGSLIEGCNVSYNGSNGISIANKTTVTANQVTDNAGHGINIFGEKTIVSSNIVTGNGGGSFWGIQNTDKDNGTITNNLVFDNANGIRLQGGDSNIIRNNQVLSNTGTGIEVQVTCTKTKIGTNEVTGNGTDYIISATDTQILAQHDTGISNDTTVDSVAALEMRSTTQGVLWPRMTAAQASAITPVEGLMLFVTTTDATFLAVGYWAYESGAWRKLSTASAVLSTKSAIVASGSFAGSPFKATVAFATAFADNNYSITITGEDSRAWSVETKTAAGFVINSNSAVAITGNTFYQAIKTGETI